MTIGFDGSRAFILNKTGTENYSYQLLKALSKIDQQNEYIVYLRPGVNPGSSWPWNFKFQTIKWWRLWTQGGLAIQTFIDSPDILFVPSHTLPIIRKRGLKTVVAVHDLGSEYLPSMHKLKQRLYLSYMQRSQLKNATHIIAVSLATKDDLMKKIGIRSDKITVVYEGFDKNIFKPKNNRPKTYYLFVGTIQPRKNLVRLIQAFSLFVIRYSLSSNEKRKAKNDLRLIIAGQKGWLSDEIYKLPGKLGIEDRVKFLGYVPDAKLPALYSEAIALTFPSLFEGFGLPILEAQACGCPVLTSSISSMPEVAGKGALYVDPYSIDDIVKGMERLQRAHTESGEGYRQQLIKAGFENVKKFSWEKSARETLRVLESL